jgi:serine/threonine protein kinase
MLIPGWARKDWTAFYASEILVALGDLHGRGIVYRDLKPENVMVDAEGHVKVIDFGFAKVLGKGKDKVYTNCGTMGYAAPEVISGQGYSFSADIWSFGILLAEIITG